MYDYDAVPQYDEYGMPKRRRQSRPAMSPEEEASFVGDVIGGVMTPLQYAGEMLDKPMRAVRGLINGGIDLMQGEGWDNANFGGGLLNLIPFSDALQLTDPTKAVYGRDLLENAGVASENVEGLGGKDWGDVDWGDALADAAGFGLDMVNVLPLVSGSRAVTKAGEALRKTGILDDAMRVAAKPVTGVSRRLAQRGVKAGTVDEAVALATDLNRNAASDLARYAQVQGIDPADLAGQRVGYSYGVRVPFGEGIIPFDPAIDAIKSVLPDAITTRAARARDLAENNPVSNWLRRSFSPAAQEFGTFDMQTRVGPYLQRKRELDAIQGSQKFGAALTNLAAGTPERQAAMKALGGADQDVNVGMYRMAELPESELLQHAPQSAIDAVSDMGTYHRDYMADLATRKDLAMVDSATLQDDYADYARRQQLGHKGTRNFSGNNAVVGSNDPANMMRADYTRNYPGGTGALIEGYKATKDLDNLVDIAVPFEQQLAPQLNRLQSDAATLAGNLNAIQQQRAALPSGSMLIPALDGQIAAMSADLAALEKRVRDVIDQPAALAQNAQALPRASRAAGVYTDFLGNQQQRSLFGEDAIVRANVVDELLNDPTLARSGTPGVEQVPLGPVLQQLGRTAERAAMEQGRLIDRDFADELLNANQRWRGPSSFNQAMEKFIDPLNNLFSALNTNIFPNFSVRNRGSGAVSDALNGGAFPLAPTVGQRTARALALGDALPDDAAATFASNPDVDAVLRRLARLPQGQIPDDQVAALLPNALREVSAGSLGSLNRQGKGLESLTAAPNVTAAGVPTSASAFDQGFIGGVSGEKAFHWTGDDSYLDALTPKGVESFYPSHVEGAGSKYFGFGGDPRGHTDFLLAKAGKVLDSRVESQNRVGPFLDRLNQGLSPSQAAREVNATQINYSPRNYTNFENEIMRRLVPFYKFQSRSLGNIADDLLTNPGGRRGTFYRGLADAQRVAGSDDDPLPPHVRESVGIPLGTGVDGSIRALTGLGLAEEAPLEFIDPNGKVGIGQDTLYKMLASLNPLITLGIEQATNRSLFQRGVDGARELDDLDPTLGRTMKNASDLLTNLGVTDEGILNEGDVHQLPTWLENAAAHSPLSRLLRSARVASDPRKLPEWMGGSDTSADVPWAGPLNLLTGLRLSDVNVQSQEKALRDMISAKYRQELGAKTINRPYVPGYLKAEMSEAELSELARYEAALNLIDQRRRKRKAAGLEF